MANCADNVYVIKYTDSSKGTITIMKSALITNLVDVALVGKSRRDYGEVFNESLLHLLENFACPASVSDINKPDTTVAFGTLLNNPIDGQRWFNSTNKRMYIYDGKAITPHWIPLSKLADVSGNSGIIAHGEFLPRPIGKDGYVFPYSECSFVVSQHSNRSVASDTYLPTSTEMDYVQCSVGTNGKVTMQFRFRGESALRSGYANYQIIGIRGSTNTPVISVTPLPIPSPTPGVSSTPQPTPDPSMTPTPTLGASPTPTPTTSLGATATPTPTPSSSRMAVTPTSTLTPTPTVSVTKSVTPTPTPTPSPVYSIQLSAVPTELDSLTGMVPAWVSLDFNPDGTFLAKIKNATHSSGVYLPSGVGANYEMYYTYEGQTYDSDIPGTFPISDPGPGANQWLSLGATRSFYMNDAQQSTNSYANITYTIRRVGQPTDSSTASLYITVDGECFAVGTMLATANGNVNVEDLKVGDYVSNFYQEGMIDESDDNWRDWKTTDNKFTYGESKVVSTRRFFADKSIDINGIVTTEEHIHFVFDGTNYGWKNANTVLMSDKLVAKDGSLIDILNITVINERREFVAVNVEDIDTLMVSHEGKTILAHNMSA